MISSTSPLMYSDCHSASLLPRVPIDELRRGSDAKRVSHLVLLRRRLLCALPRIERIRLSPCGLLPSALLSSPYR